MLVTLFFVLLLGAGAGRAADRDCSPLGIVEGDKVTYCESVQLASEPITAQKVSFTISVESKFFDGLERQKTSNGFVFRKDKRDVTQYPDSLMIVVEVESPELLLHADDDVRVPKRPLRLPPEQTPRRVVIRWLDGAKVLGGETLQLEEVVEPWRELSAPQVWYRAKVSNVNQPLSANLEVTVLGESSTPLTSIIGKL